MRNAAHRVGTCLLLIIGLLLWSVAVTEASPVVRVRAASHKQSAEVSVPTEAPVPSGGTGPVPLPLESPFSESHALTPEQVSVDAESRLKFSGLGKAAALSLAEEDFRVEQPSWTPPGAEDGGKVEGYVGEHGAVVALPNSAQHVVVSSTVPLRSNNGSGLAPVSFSLRESDGLYVPANPLVQVAIAAKASGGVSFASGVSVAPVSSGGGEAPIVVGDSVVFHETARDTDYLEEAIPSGAEVSWVLRSQESPESNALAFNLPAGAVLQASTALPGGAEVLEEGKPVLVIPPAVAEDADGRAVATSYSIAGNVLTTHVSLSGNVDFPVKVDPIFTGYYGEANGANVWSGWEHCGTYGCGNSEGCVDFCYYEYSNLIQVGTNPGAANESYGEWYIYAPGWANAEGAGITRVDLSDVTHREVEQSDVQAAILNANGAQPIWTYDGYVQKDDRPQPLNTSEALTNQPIAFCAESAEGEDGNEKQPLCDEIHNQGQAFWIDDKLTSQARTVYNYTQLSGATITYRDVYAPNKIEVYNLNEEWLQASAEPSIEIHAHDEGLGIRKFEVKIPPGVEKSFFTEELPCKNPNGFVGCPQTETSDPISLTSLPTGKWTLGLYALDAAENVAELQPNPTVYVDSTKPVIGTLSGTLAQAAGKAIGDGNYTLSFDPVDGSTASPQSGVRTVEVKVDGQVAYSKSTSCAKPKGVPAEGCFALSGSWTMKGSTYGVGTHTITVVAKDWAGNEESSSFNVTVNEASYEPVGPGSVNLETGDYQLGATDVAIPSGATTLSVVRTFNSQKTAQEEAGPLGPHWTLSVPGPMTEWHGLVPLNGGAAIALTNARGETVTFTQSGSSYTSPAGYQSETLSKLSANEYKLTDTAGDYTLFTQETGVTSFAPTQVVQASGAGGLNTVRYLFEKSASGAMQPKEVIGPEPSSEACKTTLVKGCRALMFKYATSKTATGESEAQWGNYVGRLEEITFTAWEPIEGGMRTVAVAHYAWDNQGRLRSEWDPRVTPAPLKTDMGYNSEGLLTALTPPGQETWAITYGTLAADPSNVRALKVARAQASAELWNGKLPEDKELPKISGKPAANITLGVSNGTWGNEPAGYSYQWENCNSKGEACLPILGATNSDYTLPPGNIGYTLVAIVTATNGGGSVSAVSPPSAVVGTEGVEGTHYPPAPGSTIEYDIPVTGTVNGIKAPYPLGSKEVAEWKQTDIPAEATAIFPPDEPQSWPASSFKRASIFYMDSENRTVNVATPSTATAGAISTTEYEPNTNNVIRTLSPDNREAALKEGSKSASVAEKLSTQHFYNTPGTELVETLGPEHAEKLDGGGPVTSRHITTFEYDQGEPGGGPHRLVTTTTEGSLATGGNVEDKRTVKTSYSGQENLGWELHEPTSSTTTAGNVTLKSTTSYERNTGQVEETQTPAAAGKDEYVPATTYAAQFGTKGSGAGQLEQPTYDALNASGDEWVSEDKDNRVSEFSPSGAFMKTIGWGVSNGEAKLEVCTTGCKAGIGGSGKEQLEAPTGIAISGENLYIVDSGNDRIQVINENGKWEKQWGTAGSAEGQFKIPLAIGIGPTGAVWVGDSTNRRVQEFSLSGTFIEAIGFGVSNGEATFQICKSKCQAGIKGSEPGQFASTWGLAVGNGKLYVTDTGNNRVEEFNEKGEIAGEFGSKGSSNGDFEAPIGIAVDATTGNVVVTDTGNNRVEEFTPAGGYIAQFGVSGAGNGQLDFPEGVVVNTAGDISVVDDLNHRVEEWAPTIGNEAAHTTRTVYYAAGTARTAECSNHPEWAGLPCEAGPAHQPETGLPNLPITTYTYNMWQEPLTTTDTVGATERTTTITYDSAGRPETATITANADTALPAVTDKYNEKTGALEQQSTTNSEKHTETLSIVENTLGQMTSYTDADKNTSTYEYEKEKDDRLVKVNDGKGTQTFSYNTTTGLVSSLEDSAAGTFTVGRDIEGNILTETYPNGMTATSTLNQVGERTSLEYTKGTDTIYKDSIIPSIHGQWLSQTSSLSSENYKYTEPGWLAEVQETPAGKGCTTRLYNLDEDGNRTSQTTREPGSEGKCATEGGTIQSWSYDTADQLDETGVSYDPFENTTELPPQDAGGKTLHSTYYVSNMLATLEQGEEKISYQLDPAGRTRETVNSGTVKSTVITHYASPADAPSWTANGTSWMRLIAGIGSGLAAIQTSSGTTTLEVANLHGDIVGTVPDATETEPKLAGASEPTEFGVPATSKPEPYAWLGTDERRTELATGVIAMGARAYIPQLGRFEQPDPQPGASINAYAYTSDDPINEADPSGEHGGTVIYDEEAIGEGPGVDLPGGVGVAPGATMPPPVNMQIEEEGNAHPPWDAASAFDGEAVSMRGFSEGRRPGDFIVLGAAGHGTPAPKGGSGGKANEGESANCRDRQDCKPKGPAGGNPWEPGDALCAAFWWAVPEGCGPYLAAQFWFEVH
jgi:RHS repeat-associated protein